jgi:CHAT domain-containing protein
VEIEAMIAGWGETLARDPRLPGVEEKCLARGVALRTRVWQPLGLATFRRIFLVPDGALHQVHFAALPDGRGQFVLDSVAAVHYASAERDIPRAPGFDERGNGLLALGGALFDLTAASGGPVAERRSPCREFETWSFGPLPGSAREVDVVASLWRGSTQGRDPEETLGLKGIEATESAFKARAPGRRVVHLATHGFFLGAQCRKERPLQRGIGRLAAPTLDAADRDEGESPLLMAGLALTGANRRAEASADSDDGILTAEEIASLDLSGVEWAVLSACDTGVGDAVVGEGVLGLRRAFEVAGVGTLIMSLWPVDDEPALEWMEALYRARFVRGLDTAESVSEASRELLARQRRRGEGVHPGTWGPFIAVGDWR